MCLQLFRIIVYLSSGHQSEKVFEKYIKVGVSDQADRIFKKMQVLKVADESKKAGSC